MGKTRRVSQTAIAALLVAAFSAFPVWGDEVAEVWSRVYKRAASIFQKHEIVQSMVELDNRDLAPVFIEALDELNKWEGRSLDTREIVAREETKLLVVKELGELKAAEAAPLLWQVVDETEEPILKSEALVALGKTGDKRYAQQIARILESLNLYRGKRAADEDIIALGCIRALEAMKDIVGYKPIFYATGAGYQSRVSERAEKALENITDDPTPVLKEIIADEADLSLKRLALDQAIASGAPEAGKLEVAVEALYQGITVSTTRIVENTSLMEMRKTALQLVRDLAIESDAAVFLIEKVLYLNTDENEKLHAIEALTSIGNRGAAQALTRFLGEQNNRRGEDLTTETDRILIAVIKALAEIGDDVAYEELLRAEFADYSYDVEVEARAALEVYD